MLAALLVGLGAMAGFLSGLLGIGGGVLMVPLLLYLPPLMGQPAFDMKAVAGITMVQSLAASLAGTLAHGRRRVFLPLVSFMGAGMAAGALVGGVLSAQVSGPTLQILFAGVAALAGLLLFLPVGAAEGVDDEAPAFHRPAALALGLGLGLVGGMVGQGGGFLIVPALIYLLRIPTRIALGSSLAIGLASGTAGFLGKAMTAQIPLWPTVAVVAVALVGSMVGSRVSRGLSQAVLRRALAVVVLGSAVRIGWGLLPTAAVAGALSAR